MPKGESRKMQKGELRFKKRRKRKGGEISMINGYQEQYWCRLREIGRSHQAIVQSADLIAIPTLLARLLLLVVLLARVKHLSQASKLLVFKYQI